MFPFAGTWRTIPATRCQTAPPSSTFSAREKCQNTETLHLLNCTTNKTKGADVLKQEKMREDVGRVGGNAPHRLASKRRLTSRRSALPLTGGYQRRIVFAGRPPPAFL